VVIYRWFDKVLEKGTGPKLPDKSVDRNKKWVTNAWYLVERTVASTCRRDEHNRYCSSSWMNIIRTVLPDASGRLEFCGTPPELPYTNQKDKSGQPNIRNFILLRHMENPMRRGRHLDQPRLQNSTLFFWYMRYSHRLHRPSDLPATLRTLHWFIVPLAAQLERRGLLR
jgi:hypothetical protein